MDVVFTPAAVLELLNQIDELKDYNLGLSDEDENQLVLEVGSSSYSIDVNNLETVDAPEEVVDTVEEINDEAIEGLVEVSDFEITEDVVESGIVKEAIKSLLLGGAIRLIKQLV